VNIVKKDIECSKKVGGHEHVGSSLMARKADAGPVQANAVPREDKNSRQPVVEPHTRRRNLQALLGCLVSAHAPYHLSMKRSAAQVDVVGDVEHRHIEPHTQWHVAVLPRFLGKAVYQVREQDEAHGQQSTNDTSKEHHPTSDACINDLQLTLSDKLLVCLCRGEANRGELCSGRPLPTAGVLEHHDD